MKQGQVTIFIVVGIVVLFGLAFFLYIRSQGIDLGEEARPVIERVPVEFQPLRNFVDLCIIKTTEDGLRKLGQHGGYIDPVAAGLVSNPSNPTEGNAFRFFPQDSNSEVAYWHYFSSRNECTENCACASERPPLVKETGSNSIQAQLEGYVDEHMESCLDDFKPFVAQGFSIQSLEAVSTAVEFAEDDTVVTVTYPLDVRRNDAEERLEHFIVRIPLDFRRVYEIAAELAQAHQTNHYLEWWTQEQIDVFSLGVDENKLPPTGASVFDPGERAVQWSKQEVKTLLENSVLPLYTPFLKIYGTRNFNYNTEQFYERAYIPIVSPTNTSYLSLAVAFEYLSWWPSYFELTGRGVKGDRISAETLSVPFFSFLGVQRYNYYYDLSYPVRVHIHDTEALNSEGYDFYLGLESNIRNNKPLNCTVPEVNTVVGSTNSLLCDPAHACATVDLSIVDAVTGEPLEAQVSYGSSSEMCAVGNSNDVLSLPQCIGPGCTLSIELNGYVRYSETYSVVCSPRPTCNQDAVLCNGESLAVQLEPLRTTKAVVKKKRLFKQDPTQHGVEAWQFDPTSFNLLNDESAVISLEKITGPGEDPLFITQQYEGQPVTLVPGIVPGEYEARVDVFYHLPDSTGRTAIVFAGDPGLGISDQPFNASRFSIGGAVFNFTLTADDLDRGDTLVFHAITAPDPSMFTVLGYQDTSLLGMVDNFSQQYRAAIEPQVQ